MIWTLVFITLLSPVQAEAHVVDKYSSMMECFEARDRFYRIDPTLHSTQFICTTASVSADKK